MGRVLFFNMLSLYVVFIVVLIFQFSEKLCFLTVRCHNLEDHK